MFFKSGVVGLLAVGLINSIKEKTMVKKNSTENEAEVDGRSILDDILDVRKEAAAVKEKIRKLEALRREQAEVISIANAAIPAQSDFRQKREDILAGIAMGNASEGDLKALDEQVKKKNREIEEAKAKAHGVIESAKQTIAGLERAAAEIRSELEPLQTKEAELQRWFLQAERERAEESYVQAAKTLVSAYKRLLAFDQIATPLIGTSLDKLGQGDGLLVPTFHLPAFGCSWPDLSSRNELNAQAMYKTHSEELQRLKSLGINL